MVKPVHMAKAKTTNKKAARGMQKQSTVLIVNAHRTKTLNVSTWFLRAIKPLLWCLSIATIGLTAGLSVLGYQYYQNAQTTSELQEEVTQLQNFTSAEIEAKLTALQASESTVNQLQAYLKAKGVPVEPVDYQTRTDVSPANQADNPVIAGGPEIKLSKPIPYVGEFKSQADELLEKTRHIPLGMPHDGALSSRFGVRRNPFTGRGGEMHGGLDFRGTTGEPISTTADGTVEFAGVQRGYGNVVIVKHAHGYKTYYAHLSAIDVTKGQKVQSGDVVGKLGSTGRSTGPHLHYEVRLNNERLDPENFLHIENTEPAA